MAGDRALIMAIVNRTPDSFYDRGATFTDDAASWRTKSIDLLSLARARETFAITFGSCSFDDPRSDLRALGWLNAE